MGPAAGSGGRGYPAQHFAQGQFGYKSARAREARSLYSAALLAGGFADVFADALGDLADCCFGGWQICQPVQQTEVVNGPIIAYEHGWHAGILQTMRTDGTCSRWIAPASPTVS